jgi:hypothetical protein
MRTKVAWIVLGCVLLTIFALTFMKSPEDITALLTIVSRDVKTYSAVAHILFILVLAFGLFIGRIRSLLFSFFIALLSLSATIISVIYMIVPNIILFALFFVLIIQAYVAKNLNFPLRNARPVDPIFGTIALVFGFWYLHWVDSPIWLNALLYSPLGAVNCPTMITICGFLSLSQQPRSPFLEGAVASTTLYFGFFGLFRLGAYVDIALILCGLFLLLRLSSYMTRDALLKEAEVTK